MEKFLDSNLASTFQIHGEGARGVCKLIEELKRKHTTALLDLMAGLRSRGGLITRAEIVAMTARADEIMRSGTVRLTDRPLLFDCFGSFLLVSAS
jgi:hypothetical protein